MSKTRFGTHKEIRKLIRRFRHAGGMVEHRGSGHFAWIWDGCVVARSSSTPKNGDLAVKEILRDLKRQGVDLDGAQTSR